MSSVTAFSLGAARGWPGPEAGVLYL